VLQRDRPVTVWGFAAPGVTVTTQFSGGVYGPAAADGNGTWRQVLPATAAGGPYVLAFNSSDGGAASLVDVLFGDVHLCGGQSNMQFTLLSNAGVPNVTAELADANNYPNIRVFTVGQGTTSTTPLRELGSIEQAWVAASNASIGLGGWTAFSAVCWFTYRDVYNALGGTVPQGLVSNNWGGTPYVALLCWLHAYYRRLAPPASRSPTSRQHAGSSTGARRRRWRSATAAWTLRCGTP